MQTEIPPERDKQEELFASDLRRLMQSLSRGEFTRELCPLDILFAYRLLLWRNPETIQYDELMARVHEFGWVETIARGFLSSREFRQKYHGTSLREDGRVVIVRDGNLRIAVDPFDLVLGWAIINGRHENQVRWVIESLVNPGDRCIDMGANAGFFTAIMANRAGEQGHVFAFEPFPLVLRLLRITLEESGIVRCTTVREVACSDVAGDATLFFPTASDNYGGAFVVEGTPDERFEPHSVRTVRIDDDLAGEPPVQFVKLDIEGSELRALRGARARLAVDKPIVVTEISAGNLKRHGHTPGDLIDFLSESDYDSFSVEDLYSGQVVQLESRQLPAGCENVVAIPRFRSRTVVESLLAMTPDRTSAT